MSEFERAGLQMAPSRLVAPPRVASAACAMECRVVHHLQLRDLAGEAVEQYLVVGQVVGVHLDERALRDGLVDTAALRPIARCGGPSDYTVVDTLFQMVRPRV
jgi:flavin reductase (DIM6/NTAB) family NADH-FMN oxidoreductase RutF